NSIQQQGAADFSKVTFLIVDDKPFYRDMSHTALTRAKARNIEHASDVDKALKVISRYGQRIGCIIADWDMAPDSGLLLLRKIRSRAISVLPPNTPFVILTGRADSDAIKTAMALDVSGVAIAPLSFDKLIKTISNAINRTWELKAKEHYAAVQLVQSTKAAPPPDAARGGVAKGVILHGDAKEKMAAKAAAAAAAANQQTASIRKPAQPIKPELTKVRLTNLKHVSAGDIVARDIKDKESKMLVSAGTELSASLIERLKGLSGGYPDSFHLWVGEWEK
ncbi:MAG: response regulator, partial [Rhodospirillaceae bacterium]